MKIKFVALASASILCFSSCAKTSESTPIESIESNQTDVTVDIEKLKGQYPEYFKMETFKGIEVYVWQMSKDSYRCGMMSGTNRVKSPEEIADLQFKSLSIEEAKAILVETGVKKDEIFIYPISQAYSSYYYEVDDSYREKVAELFDITKEQVDGYGNVSSKQD